MGIVPEVDGGDNGFVERISEALQAAVDAEGVVSFAERERQLLRLANESIRHCLQAALSQLCDEHGEEVEVAGKRYVRHQPGRVTYHSLCGALQVERYSYRQVGVRNGPTLVPVELEAGIVERCTPSMASAVAVAYAKAPMRSYEEDLAHAHRVAPPRTTLERLAKRIGTKLQQTAVKIERVVRRTERLPKAAHAVSLGLDRTSLPMEETRPNGTEPATRRKKRTKPRVRRAPAPVDVKYRMGYVGTVSINDEHGESLIARRYAIAAHDDPKTVVARMMADLRHALKQNPGLRVGVVQDAAPELWGLMWEAMNSEPRVRTYQQTIDRYHLSHRLAQLLEALQRDRRKRKAQLRRWERSLDVNDRAIERIHRWAQARYVKRLASCRSAAAENQLHDTVGQHVNYICRNRWHMFRYASVRRLGLHGGSGVTEGACKSLIAARAKRSGQRWRPQGIDAVLALRSLHHSDRLRPVWHHFAKSYTQTVIAIA